MISSYPHIYNLGHTAVESLLTYPIIVEEKVDGSQISFSLTDKGLEVRSKGAEIYVENPPKLFQPAVEYIKSITDKLMPGWVYRGEAVCKPKHNVLTYNRCPEGFVILFDIETSDGGFLPWENKWMAAERIGLECVSTLWLNTDEEYSSGRRLTEEILRGLLDKESCLGGVKVEGVVIKPMWYDVFGRDKKVLMGKFVSERFKEVLKKDWVGESSGVDVVEDIKRMFSNEARWNKAVQHLIEAGLVNGEYKDIGAIVREVIWDIKFEEEDRIKDVLWEWAWPKLQRKFGHGIAEWYKGKLLEEQFSDGN